MIRNALWPRLSGWFWPSDSRSPQQIAAEVREELEFHFSLLVAELESTGMAPEAAHEQAAKKFGDLDQYAKQCERIDSGDRVIIRRVLSVACLLLLATCGAMGYRLWQNQRVMAEMQTQLLMANTSNSQLSSNGPSETTPSVSWTPPEQPNPTAIHREMQDDTRARRYALALAKAEWYWKHALEYDDAQTGVRLSFFLSDWKKLAVLYPPALDRLRQIQEQNRAAILSPEKDSLSIIRSQSFFDYAGICESLDQQERVVELFAKLDQQDPAFAKVVYVYAEGALLKAKKYELCEKYLDVDDKFPRQLVELRVVAAGDEAMLKHFLRSEPTAQQRSSLPRLMASRVRHDAAKTVAIIAGAGQEAKALELADRAKAEWDDAELAGMLDAALNGVPPVFKVPPPR
jgi:hypothetical protein